MLERGAKRKRAAAFARRFIALAGVAIASGVAACNIIFGIDGGTAAGSGGAGVASSSKTTVNGQSAGPTTTSTGAVTSTATMSLTSVTATTTAGTSAGPTTTSTGGTTTSTGATTSSTSSGGADAGDAGASLHDGLVLLLHMDEASWPTNGSIKDSSGKGNHGNPVGTAAPTTAGKFGGAGTFDGNGFVEVLDAPTLEPTNKLTYAAWFYSTELPVGGGGIITKRTAFGQNVAFTLFLWKGDTQNFNAYVDLPGRSWSDAGFDNGQWYHVAVVYDGTLADPNQRGKIYVNGALDHPIAVPNTTLDPSDASVQVGNLPGGGQGFIGKIDEVAVWLRALDGNEILALYNATGPL